MDQAAVGDNRRGQGLDVVGQHVVAALERKGAITVENVEEVPEGSIVVFSAHGSPPELRSPRVFRAHASTRLSSAD